MEEKRIYVVVADTIKTTKMGHYGKMIIDQPPGRQVAQACHVVTKLRFAECPIALIEIDCDAGTVKHQREFEPITTVILQARDSEELEHVRYLLFRKKLNPVVFKDTNPEYGPGEWPTAVAVFATQKQVKHILGYLPLWSDK